MKRILLSCLLGIGLLLPAINAKSSIVSIKRYVTIFIEGYVLYGSSDATSGKITRIEVYDADMQELLLTQPCGGSTCQVDLRTLPAGNYEAKLVAGKTTQLKAFSL